MTTLQTTIGEGLPIEVSFDWNPGRPVRLYNPGAHPEEPAEIEITKIVTYHKAGGWTSIMCIYDALNTKTLEALETECWEKVKTDKEDAIISRGEYLRRG